MRDWTLGPGDPLVLTLAADFRLCQPDYTNDHIWELEIGGGDPSAMTLRTTYGLRARAMRLFPRFTLNNRTVSDPGDFDAVPRLRRFYPNFMLIDFSPFPSVDVAAEYWVPASQIIAGRMTLINHAAGPLSLTLELCGQLVPLEPGRSLSPVSMQSVNVLTGYSADLAPVVFLTGGAQVGPGPYPSLTIDVDLAPDAGRTLTWVQAALGNPQASFDLARRTAARPWEAERTKIELLNAAQTIEVQSGDPEWDAAFALSQKAAFGLFFGAGKHLPNPSFVLARQPDQGASRRGDGSDHPFLWSGQSPLEAYYLSSLLPAIPDLAAGLLRNFLAVQTEDGFVDCRPGLAGQRGRWLAAPLLVSLAWQVYKITADKDFLAEVFPNLTAFYRQWLAPAHDRDGDGFPEWDQPLQSGFEDNPIFTVWQEGGQGANISLTESPALAALLYREGHLLSKMATLLGQDAEREPLELQAAAIRSAAEECWDAGAVLYHYRDRDTHRSPAGKPLGEQSGAGTLVLKGSFPQPVRLLVQFYLKAEALRRPEVVIIGRYSGKAQTERLERMDFQWGAGVAVATTRKLYTSVSKVEVKGLAQEDQVVVRTMDFSFEDHTLFLPLWAEIPNSRRTRNIVNRTLFAAERFGRPFGIPACVSAPSLVDPSSCDQAAESACQSVHLPWNQLIGEGLLAYGLRDEAALLTARLMSAVVENLKGQRAFSRNYHAETGAGLGERNALQGLAPLGLFLQVLGVQFVSPRCVQLNGKNPFPWTIIVQYRGTRVTRRADQTVIIFPDGQTVTLDDPTEAVISVE